MLEIGGMVDLWICGFVIRACHPHFWRVVVALKSAIPKPLRNSSSERRGFAGLTLPFRPIPNPADYRMSADNDQAGRPLSPRLDKERTNRRKPTPSPR